MLYFRLIACTAGTLLTLFWMVLILGYRRQRNFERVFFFLCLALFLFYSGSLLALNSQIYYAHPPETLAVFSWSIIALGLGALPALLVHLHLEYAQDRGAFRSASLKRLFLAAFYAPILFFVLSVYPRVTTDINFDFLTPGNFLGRGFGIWLATALLFAVFCEFRLVTSAPDRRVQLFHRSLAVAMLVAAALAADLHVFAGRFALHPQSASTRTWLAFLLSLLPILALALLIHYVQKFNFLQIARQRNLLYAVSVAFFALLYLSLVRRVSLWLEPILPPEASAAILLFILVIFVEPLQRSLARRLHETARRELDSVRALLSEIREKAREGNLFPLIRFVEDRVKERFEFRDAWIEVLEPALDAFRPRSDSAREATEGFSIYQPGLLNAVFIVRPHGAMLSGEVEAAMKLLCEQLPAAIDVARLLEEKLRLERELAERERLAALGQMAASISHNLKNPLGSIKTILQVQLESPDMPNTLKAETKMVLAEISRLSNKLSQLLQFSRPAILGDTSAGSDLSEVLSEVTEVLRHEAGRRNIRIQSSSNGILPVTATKEAINDIVSNLILNALEAANAGGHVNVTSTNHDAGVLLCVEDDGRGIPLELREKVLQPFFTTKTQGTGLGLAIVAKRVAEAGGTLQLESPIADARGTRFSVWLPLRKY